MGRLAILTPIAKASFGNKKWQLLLESALGVIELWPSWSSAKSC
jgi:hypothetical protein